MALQTINIGNVANDGTGDDLRGAFLKVNSNFSELDNKIILSEGQAENLGAGAGIFAQKSDNTLQFKSLVAGSKITLSESGNSITITGNAGLEQLIALSDNGSVILGSGTQILTVQGGTNITTKATSTTLTIDVDSNDLIESDTSPTLGGNLNANNFNINGANNITSSNFFGALEGLVYGIDIRTISAGLTDFDFGSIVLTANSVIEFITLTTDFDFGSFATPLEIAVDGGTF